jgi:hypothetical protein
VVSPIRSTLVDESFGLPVAGSKRASKYLDSWE